MAAQVTVEILNRTLVCRQEGKIAELATESKRARRKSDELLVQAKTRVEQLIEQAVRP